MEAAARRRTAFDLVILGDSHAEYAGDPRFFPGIEMLNLGIARDTTIGVLHRLGAMPDTIATRYVLVEIGYNDLKYRAVAATAENIAHIVASIRSRWPGKPTIFVQGLFPVTGAREYTNGRIRELNGRLQALCRTQVASMSTCRRIFLEPTGARCTLRRRWRASQRRGESPMDRTLARAIEVVGVGC